MQKTELLTKIDLVRRNWETYWEATRPDRVKLVRRVKRSWEHGHHQRESFASIIRKHVRGA